MVLYSAKHSDVVRIQVIQLKILIFKNVSLKKNLIKF